MTGEILWSDPTGGAIKPDDGGNRLPFLWIDCNADVAPSSVGHGTRVQFYEEIRGRKSFAIGVRRAN